MAETKTKVVNSWINGIPVGIVREKTSAEGHKFFNVSLPVSSELGLKGEWISMAVNAGQVRKSKKDGFVNILLGKPEGTRKVSYKKGKSFVTAEVSNSAIAGAYTEHRKAYAESQAETAEG